MENTGTIFEKSDGAIIFPGEKFDLHNRVFITSAGNATYEAKEMGLAEIEYEAFSYDRAIHVVGSEQAGYFQVVIKALELVFAHLLGKKHHLSYGMVDLKAGKMSSRTGNIVSIDDLVKIISEKVSDRKIALGAIKFAYLKFSPSSNMIFNLEQSVSLEGDSGPYLQYTYARCKSVLRKAGDFTREIATISNSIRLEKEEREVARLIMYFPEVVASAAQALGPSTLCSYLFTLAQAFNLFYAKHSILGIAKSAMGQVTEANSRKASDTRILRLSLTGATAQVLKNGLYLLGIETLKKM